MKDGATLLSIADAFRVVDEALAGARLPAETAPTRAAADRVLARAHESRLDLPPFDKAAVDGYAIPAGADAAQYRLVRTVAAGQSHSAPLRAGETVKVMTGAPVPPGTARVVMQEDAEQDGELVRVSHGGAANYCPRGEDLRRGDVVLPAGSVLRPLDAANLIGCGIVEVEVVRRPRVSIISTGDEIVDQPGRLEPGKIMNVNGPLLAGLAAAHGLEVAGEVSVADAPEALSRAIEDGLARADMVVLSGGVSVGEFDFVLDTFGRAGLRLHFARLAVKPGKPTAFATGRGKAVFGLPGNPLAVFLMFHLLVLRAAARLTGAAPPLRVFMLPLAGAFKRRHAERTEYAPGRLTAEGRIEPLPCHGSAHLMAMTRADGFFAAPAGVKELLPGAAVEFLLLPGCCR